MRAGQPGGGAVRRAARVRHPRRVRQLPARRPPGPPSPRTWPTSGSGSCAGWDLPGGIIVKLGLHLPNFGFPGQPGRPRRPGPRAEAAGWDGFFIWDHVARTEGTFPMADPWIALTAVATATQRLRIGPMITPLARRRPWNVARQVAYAGSADRRPGHASASGLGVSSGPEFRHFGARRATRGCAATCSTRAWRSCGRLEGTPVRHAGTHYQVDDVSSCRRPCSPGCRSGARPSGLSGRPVRRAAGLDGVFPIGLRRGPAPACWTTWPATGRTAWTAMTSSSPAPTRRLRGLAGRGRHLVAARAAQVRVPSRNRPTSSSRGHQQDEPPS